jgi:hypothetical protein
MWSDARSAVPIASVTKQFTANVIRGNRDAAPRRSTHKVPFVQSDIRLVTNGGIGDGIHYADARYDSVVGPTVAIWPAQSTVPTGEDLLRIAKLLDLHAADAREFGIADTVRIGGTTRVDLPRPFGIASGEVGLEDAERAQAADLVGVEPLVAIHAFAFVND